MFVGGAFRRHLSGELALRAFEESLAKASTLEDCWSAIEEACRKFGFTHAELRLNGRRFVRTLVETNGNPTWNFEIPLAGGGSLQLTRCFGESQAATVLAPFAEVLHTRFRGDGGEHATAAVAAGSASGPERRAAAAGR
jgi:hypothetical protein